MVKIMDLDIINASTLSDYYYYQNDSGKTHDIIKLLEFFVENPSLWKEVADYINYRVIRCNRMPTWILGGRSATSNRILFDATKN